MATESKFSAYTQTVDSCLTTELNSLSNGSSSSAGTAEDNTTNLDLWADFVLDVTFGTNPTANTTCDLFLLPSVDGTNYTTPAAALGPYYVGSFQLQATTSQQLLMLLRVPLFPGKWKALLKNNSGQAFPASGSTVKYRSYHITNT